MTHTSEVTPIDWNMYAAQLGQFVRTSVLSTSEEEVRGAAGEVLALVDGRMEPVRRLVEVAQLHQWNSSIYEAWSWEYGNRIRAYRRRLPPLVYEALYTYANQYGDLHVTYQEAEDAIKTALETSELMAA